MKRRGKEKEKKIEREERGKRERKKEKDRKKRKRERKKERERERKKRKRERKRKKERGNELSLQQIRLTTKKTKKRIMNSSVFLSFFLFSQFCLLVEVFTSEMNESDRQLAI